MGTVSPWAFGWTQLLTIIGMLITVFIAVGGFRSFNRWKREKLEERRMELAFETLSLAYEAKFIFDHIRGPMSFPHEWEDMPEVAGETEDQRRHRGSFYAILKRIVANKEYFERVWKMQPRCMAMFGPLWEETFMQLHRARREVEVAAQMLGGHRNLADNLREKLERDVWEMGTNSDEDRVGHKLAEFRRGIEKMCQPAMDRETNRVRDWLWTGPLAVRIRKELLPSWKKWITTKCGLKAS